MSQNFQTQTFTALANEERRRIVYALVHGQLSVNDLSLLLDLSIEALTPHLEMLHQLGICTIAGNREMLSVRLTSIVKIQKALDEARRSLDVGVAHNSNDPLDVIFAA